MNTYSDSKGNRWTTKQIDRKSDRTAKMLLEIQYINHGYNFCECCHKSSGVYLDVSHTVSRKKAKENGKSELCWDISNMEILCRRCHRRKDGLL